MTLLIDEASLHCRTPRGATDIDYKVNGALGVVQSTGPSLVLPGCPITDHVTDEIFLSWRDSC